MLQCGGSNVLDDGTLPGHPLLQVTLGTVQHTTSNTVSLGSSQGISGTHGSILFTLDGKLVGVSFSEIEPGDSGCYIANPHLKRLLAEILRIYPTFSAKYTKTNLVGHTALSDNSPHCCILQLPLSNSKGHLEKGSAGRALTQKMTQ